MSGNPNKPGTIGIPWDNDRMTLMRAFEIYVNGERLCLAGVRAVGRFRVCADDPNSSEVTGIARNTNLAEFS